MMLLLLAPGVAEYAESEEASVGARLDGSKDGAGYRP